MNEHDFLRETIDTFRDEGVVSGAQFLFDNLVVWQTIQLYNRLRSGGTYYPPTDEERYSEVQAHARVPTDISDHLQRMYTESLKRQPSTIVEVGVRGGESTYVFERISEICDAHLISVDVADCSDVSDYEDWHFVQADGTKFGGEFNSWADSNGVNPDIDILFIDTTHEYTETRAEIDAWFPHLSDESTVFFHDTNLTKLYGRSDGTIGTAWNNERAVIQAIEDYFDTSFNESEKFQTVQSNHVIEHHPLCNGLTVIHRLPE